MASEPNSGIVRIERDDRLYRRINLDSHIRKSGLIAPSAYMTRQRVPDPAVSVDLARLTTPEASLARARRPERTCIGELVAAVPLDLGLRVRHVPLYDGDHYNQAHCQIEGMGSDDLELCDRLARATRLLGVGVSGSSASAP